MTRNVASSLTANTSTGWPSHDDEPVYRVDAPGGFPIGSEVSQATLGTGGVVAVTGAGKHRKIVVD